MRNADNKKMLDEINEAIDREDMEKINLILEDIYLSPDISVQKFAKNIMRMAKEENKMKNKFKIAAIAAAVAVIGCVSVGAAGYIKEFSFMKDGKYISVQTNENIDEEQAAEIAKQAADEYGEGKEEKYIEDDYDVFSTLDEAEKAYDMIIPLPKKMPALELDGIQGKEYWLGENSREATVWVSYGDPDKKAIELCVEKKEFNDSDTTSILVTDNEKTGEFISESGRKFDVLTEGNEDIKVTTMSTSVNGYSYNISYVGFTDSEIEDITNSIDLSELNK